jgi:hypothetical protein
MSDKPREFWINNVKHEPNDPTAALYFYAFDEIGDPKRNEIHVIEHAAYLAVIKERDELKQKLSIAVEALGEYQNHIIKVEGHSVHLGTKAREALEKIKPDGREEK